ncbi:MAG: molybdopterin molybdenumtransferase MoeA [Alphaproteobacteria bacterium]|nr:molybdopterin molybdenumtransferase MoeA [Alphaproteobacteria bacterium]
MTQGLLSVDDAIASIVRHRPPRAVETRALHDCLGCTLAEDVTSRVTLPPCDVSAMDGYAVRFEDARTPGAALRVIGAAPAGAPFAGRVSAGEAVRIFTGGAVPDGADHILIQEDAEAHGDTLRVSQAQSAPSHIRKAGIDFFTGDTLLRAGQRLGAAALGVAASGDHAAAPILKPLRVALLANGDELRPPGALGGSSGVISSNPFAIAALVRIWGAVPEDIGIAADSKDAIIARAQLAADADIIVAIGGASVGDHDHMKEAFLELGYDLHFNKVAVRPGKPAWFAGKGDRRVLGLPGNPASAFVCAHLFLKPLLGACDGLAETPARLAAPMAANGPRETFVRGKQTESADGLFARPLDRQDSALLTPFLEADCLIRRPAHAPAAEAGARAAIVRL